MIEDMDDLERLKLHMKITDQMNRLIARCGALRDAGKAQQARKLLPQLERLKGRLQALERR